ncbi:hypothetical protein AKJ09_09734 [Labilithrix luteola]|uniref:Uncharacterized protein n=1 Tax=Labilithrix luteola TaxID=1391654 RepID=A0A0K1QBA8_9BACT|nr:hypothetical protein [Labilithrix luteola]AKV03071.1 hypothetical protein AKJ09_09734 [Labilithrix luteola]
MTDDATTDGELRALEPTEVRARRRPLAIALVYAWQLAWGFVLATPAHAWANRSWGAHPDGDAVLFRPGGYNLVSWFLGADAALAVVTRTTLVLFVVGVLLSQIPLGALLASLATGRGSVGIAPRPASALRASIASFFPLLVVLVLTSIVQLAIVAAGAWVGSSVSRAFLPSLGETPAFGVNMVVLALFVLGACIIGVLGDVARAAVVHDVVTNDDDERRAFSRVKNALVMTRLVSRNALTATSLAWGWRAAIGVALVVAGSGAANILGGQGGGALTALTLIHQAVVLGRTALRASWLARATRLVAYVARARRGVDASD